MSWIDWYMVATGLFGGILLAVGLTPAIRAGLDILRARRRCRKGLRAAMWRPK